MHSVDQPLPQPKLLRVKSSSQKAVTLVIASAGRVVVDSTRVEDKGLRSSIHRDCHRPFGKQRLFKSILTSISGYKVTLQQHKSCCCCTSIKEADSMAVGILSCISASEMLDEL